MIGELSEKQVKRLNTIRLFTDGSSGMYPGILTDLVSGKVATALRRAGLIEAFIPHNPIHKERWVITDAGRALLATRNQERKP